MCCPNFRKSEGLAPSDEISIDAPAHNSAGPMGVSVRSPVLQGAREFVEPAEAAGIPGGDYNGRDRGGPAGVVSLLQTTTRAGKRSSTYRAFLEGEAERRTNLTIITGAQATRVILEGSPGRMAAKGVEYRIAPGEVSVAIASKEVILSAGAVGRFAPPAAAVRYRAATRARNDWRSVSRRFATCRQALEGPHTSAPVLPGARGRCLDG